MKKGKKWFAGSDTIVTLRLTIEVHRCIPDRMAGWSYQSFKVLHTSHCRRSASQRGKELSGKIVHLLFLFLNTWYESRRLTYIKRERSLLNCLIGSSCWMSGPDAIWATRSVQILIIFHSSIEGLISSTSTTNLPTVVRCATRRRNTYSEYAA